MPATITIARASMMTSASRPALSARRAASPLIRPANAKFAMRRVAVAVRASSSDDSEVSAPILAVAAAGLPSSLIVLWSSYTKATTGAGLQGDLLGGLEGVSYLVSVGFEGRSSSVER